MAASIRHGTGPMSLPADRVLVQKPRLSVVRSPVLQLLHID